VIGNGQCAVFVEAAAHMPTTHSWKQGANDGDEFYVIEK